MDKTLKVGDNMESIEHGHSLEKRRADDLDEEERQLEALIEEVYSSMGVKASLKEYSYVYLGKALNRPKIKKWTFH